LIEKDSCNFGHNFSGVKGKPFQFLQKEPNEMWAPAQD